MMISCFGKLDAGASKVRAVMQAQVDETPDIMARNIDNMLDNQKKAAILNDQTDNLAQASKQFKKQAHELKKAMWRKTCKSWFLRGGVVVVLIVALGTTLAIIKRVKRRKSKSKSKSKTSNDQKTQSHKAQATTAT